MILGFMPSFLIAPFMSVKLAVGEKLGVIPLSEHLVRGDCHRVREVQAPRLFNHRDSHTSLPVLYKQTFGQTARLLAEHKVTAVAVLGVGVAVERLRCKIEKFSALEKPNGLTRWSLAPVAAQVRAMLPVFAGISGSTSTMFSVAKSYHL